MSRLNRGRLKPRTGAPAEVPRGVNRRLPRYGRLSHKAARAGKSYLNLFRFAYALAVCDTWGGLAGGPAVAAELAEPGWPSAGEQPRETVSVSLVEDDDLEAARYARMRW